MNRACWNRDIHINIYEEYFTATESLYKQSTATFSSRVIHIRVLKNHHPVPLKSQKGGKCNLKGKTFYLFNKKLSQIAEAVSEKLNIPSLLKRASSQPNADASHQINWSSESVITSIKAEALAVCWSGAHDAREERHQQWSKRSKCYSLSTWEGL